MQSTAALFIFFLGAVGSTYCLTFHSLPVIKVILEKQKMNKYFRLKFKYFKLKKRHAFSKSCTCVTLKSGSFIFVHQSVTQTGAGGVFVTS